MGRIDKLFKDINQNRTLGYNSYIFYNKNLTRDREIFESYIATVGEEKIDYLIEYADKYISDTSDYFKSFIGRNAIFENRKELLADEKSKCKELSRILGELYIALDNTGIIDVLVNRHNELCEKNSVEVMKVTRQDVDPEFDVDMNSRSKLTFVNLKNAFWLNKYIKMIDAVETQEMYNKNFANFNMENLKPNQLNYLLYMASQKYEILKSIRFEGITAKDERVEKRLCRTYEGEYQETFEKIFPGVKHDIFEDYEKAKHIEDIKDILYDKKNMFMTYAFMNQLMEHKYNSLNPSIKCWGIEDKKTNNFIAMGLELEGYMLPATFHVPLYVYKQIMDAMGTKKLDIPKLEVPQRIDKEDSFSTNVLVRPSAEQTKLIKLEAKKRGKQQELLKRVYEQISGKPHSYAPTEFVELNVGEEK